MDEISAPLAAEIELLIRVLDALPLRKIS